MRKSAETLFLLLLLSACLLVIYTCKKLKKSMLVSTGEVTNIETNSAEASGMVVDLGEGATQHGHCYGTSPNVTIAGSKTQLGKPPVGGFTSQLTGLTAGTKYYIKAYISNGLETVYGKEITFTTVAPSQASISTTEITSITTTTANSGGNVTNDGGAPVTERGICWNTSTGPSISNSKTTDGTGTGSFTSSMTGLTPGTTYYVRSYATNTAGTAYGNERTFSTVATSTVIPTLTTTEITGITLTTASGGGNISSDGGASVTARGVCWNTSANPTIALSTKTSDGNGTGTFTSSITGLTAGTTYYVRAYATNSTGTGYGNEVSFTSSSATATLPTLTTAAITDITQDQATSGGNVTSDGGSQVMVRGICWNTSPNPVVTGNELNSWNSGFGTGSFVSYLTGLTANTKYYVRAFATNDVGTAYGDELNFTTNTVTLSVPGAPTIGMATAGNTQATVAFTAPASDGGSAISGYTVTSNPGGKTGTGAASPITVTGLTNGTAYTFTVTATNAVGTGPASSASNSVTPSTVPAAPTIGTAIKGDAQATVTFTAPANDGGSAITGYTVTSNPDGHTGTGSLSPITVTGLANGTAYTFTVVATNANGNSAQSAPSNSVTPSTVPDAPTGVSATAGNAQATITFTAPADDGGSSITGYTVTSNPNGHTSTGSASPITVTGLANGTAYTFTVVATNANGNSAQSAASNSVTPSTVPDAPTGVSATAGNAQATITFTAPADDGGSAITGYTVTSDPEFKSGTGIASPITVIGLTNGTAYTFTVEATNVNGPGPASAPSNSVTPVFICGESINFTHSAGTVAPVTKTVTYGTVVTNLTGANKCWITQNLGADTQAGSATDATQAPAGWYWQFNRKQGYKHDGSTRTPGTMWIDVINEASDWTAANDPCTILLGTGWRIPTSTEWTSAKNNGGWGGYDAAFASVLKLHTAGYLSSDLGNLVGIGLEGSYYSSTAEDNVSAWSMYIVNTYCLVLWDTKAFGASVRCLKD